MSDIKVCCRCGKILITGGFYDLCPECRQEDDSTFDTIRGYLYEHPYASLYEVSTNLNISVRRIKRYLREGRLEIVEKENIFLKCEKCGAPIQSGRYCDGCFAQSAHGYKGTLSQYTPSKTDIKFNYFADYENKLSRVKI